MIGSMTDVVHNLPAIIPRLFCGCFKGVKQNIPLKRQEKNRIFGYEITAKKTKRHVILICTRMKYY